MCFIPQIREREETDKCELDSADTNQCNIENKLEIEGEMLGQPFDMENCSGIETLSQELKGEMLGQPFDRENCSGIEILSQEFKRGEILGQPLDRENCTRIENLSQEFKIVTQLS